MARKFLIISVMAWVVGPSLWAQPGGIRLLGTQAGRPGKVVKGAPYSADVTNETTRMLADGNTIHQITSGRVYRDSEGRTRQESALQALSSAVAGRSTPRLAFIYDPAASVSYVLDLVKHTATRTVWPQDTAASATNPPQRQLRRDPANIKRESLGTQLFSGLMADVTRTTLTIPIGQIGNSQPISVVTERWRSPDLQVVVYSKRIDPREGETVFQLTNINRSEPPAALFTAPSDFSISDVQPRTRGSAGPR